MFWKRLPALFALCVGCSSTTQSGQVDSEPSPAVTSSSPAAAPTSAAPSDAPASTAPAGNVKTIFVDSKRVACEGEGVTECLRIKDAPDASWTLFYRTIEGFEFEPGYLYELRVEVTEVKNPQADASSRRHRLVEVASKKKAP
jgi:hypothetical protein